MLAPPDPRNMLEVTVPSLVKTNLLKHELKVQLPLHS